MDGIRIAAPEKMPLAQVYQEARETLSRLDRPTTAEIRSVYRQLRDTGSVVIRCTFSGNSGLGISAVSDG